MASSEAALHEPRSSPEFQAISRRLGTIGKGKYHGTKSTLSRKSENTSASQLLGLSSLYQLFQSLTLSRADAPGRHIDPSVSSEQNSEKKFTNSASFSKTQTLKENQDDCGRNTCNQAVQTESSVGKSEEGTTLGTKEQLNCFLIRELDKQLQEEREVSQKWQVKWDRLLYGYHKSVSLLDSYLGNFVKECSQTLRTEKKSAILKCLAELTDETSALPKRMLRCFDSAIGLLTNKETREELIALDGLSDLNPDEENDLNYKQKIKIADRKVIDSLRKFRNANLKRRETEQKLDEERGVWKLKEESLKKEILRLKSRLDEFEAHLGPHSDYSKQAAESVRSVIESLVIKNSEVEKQLCEMEMKLSLERNWLEDLERRNTELASETEVLRKTSYRQALDKAQTEIETLKKDEESFQEEKMQMQTLLADLKEEHSTQERELREINTQLQQKASAFSSQTEDLKRTLHEKETEMSKIARNLSQFSSRRRSLVDRGIDAPDGLDESWRTPDYPSRSRQVDSVASLSSSRQDKREEPSLGLLSRNFSPRIQSTCPDPRMSCLKCGKQFSVACLEEYESHIKQCYKL
eukprot:m.218086 g.218086  ORF g.218086 m.218086 type:complete len:580 (+) comp39887_c0_seq42:364-2103(+)